MDDRILQELRALLFGKPPYGRPGAPEPEVLAELAPTLDPSEREMAFRTLSMVGFMGEAERLQGLARLLTHMSLGDPAFQSLLGEGLLQFPALVRELPPELVPPALQTLTGKEWNDDRWTEVLVSLADRFRQGPAGDLIHSALTAELDRIARLPFPAYYHSNALLSLLDHWPAPLPGETAALLLSLTRKVEDTKLRARLSSCFLPLTSGPLWELAREIALEAVVAIEPKRDQAEALIALSDRIQDPLRSQALEEAFSLAKDMDLKENGRTEIMADLSLRLTGPSRAEAVDEAAAPYKRGVFIYPPAEEALAQAFAYIGRNLPETLKGAIREQVRSLPIPDECIPDLAPYLSEEQLSKALEGLIRPSEYFHLLFRTLYSLVKLAPHLPPRLLGKAIELAGALEEKQEHVKARVLMILGPFLSQELAGQSLKAARQIHSPWWRGRVLGTIVHHLPAPEQKNCAPDIDLVSPRRMCELLARLPEAEHKKIVEGLNSSVWDLHGGGAPPPPGPEEGVVEPIPASIEEKPIPLPSEILLEETRLEKESQAPPSSPAEGTGESIPEPEKAERGTAEISPPSIFESKRGQEIFTETPLMRAGKELQEDEQVVNTGFSPHSDPASVVDPNTPLALSKNYYFWLEVGLQVPGSIEEIHAPLPRELLPERARLKVVLFPFPGGLQLIPGATQGELQLLPGVRVTVARQPSSLPAPLADSPLSQRRLFFPLRTPDRAGSYSLRCNIYYQQLLVQSRLVRVWVMSAPGPVKGALRSTLDYTLTQSLRAEQLSPLSSYRLSLMLNDNGDGTHSFRFFGEKDIATHAHFDAGQLQDLIQQARGALRRASWDDENEWQEEKTYRYGGPRDLLRLKQDLVRLAIRGYRFYDQIIDALSGEEDADRLADLMRKPGLIQIAFKESERLLLPAAMIYDHPLDTALGDYQLCPAFSLSLEEKPKLEESPCFQGRCPSYGQPQIVCPSGFWGFRHALGMPLSIGQDGLSAHPYITYRGTPQMLVGVSTDPGFKLRKAHETTLQNLTGQKGWQYLEGDKRDEVLALMRDQKPQLVYFFCHGGMVGSLPYLKVGAPEEMGITRDNLRNERIRWKENRPLVFINGCHTAALEPEKAFNFVGAFVKTAYASGVIGTEITIFEHLGRAFAEEFIERFLAGDPLGQAVRGARLALLKQGNPLGLVYLPFALADLRLAPGGKI